MPSIINYRGSRSTHRSSQRGTLRNTLSGSKHERHSIPAFGGKKRRTKRRVSKRGRGKTKRRVSKRGTKRRGGGPEDKKKRRMGSSAAAAAAGPPVPKSSEFPALAAASAIEKRAINAIYRPVGQKLSRMEIAQLFMLRKDLREVRKRLDKDTLNSVIKRVAEEPKTLKEQEELLAILSKPFAEKQVGRWTEDMSTNQRFWCPHHLTCLTEDECYDKQEHDRTRHM